MGKAIAATAGARATAGNTLRTSNLVRSAHAAYETFCKLESEYPLTVLATPPLQKSMTWICHLLMAQWPPNVTETRDWPKRPKTVCAAFQHTQQKVIRRKYSGTLFQYALDFNRGGQDHTLRQSHNYACLCRIEVTGGPGNFIHPRSTTLVAH